MTLHASPAVEPKELPITLRELVPGHNRSTGEGVTPVLDAKRRRILLFMLGETSGESLDGVVYVCPLDFAGACTVTHLGLPIHDVPASRTAVSFDLTRDRLYAVHTWTEFDGPDDRTTAWLTRCAADGSRCAAPVAFLQGRARNPLAGDMKRNYFPVFGSLEPEVLDDDGAVVVTGGRERFDCDPDTLACRRPSDEAAHRIGPRTKVLRIQPPIEEDSRPEASGWGILRCAEPGRGCRRWFFADPPGRMVIAALGVSHGASVHVFESEIENAGWRQTTALYARCDERGTCDGIALPVGVQPIGGEVAVDPAGKAVWALGDVEKEHARVRLVVLRCAAAGTFRCDVLQTTPPLPYPWFGMDVRLLFLEGKLHILYMDEEHLGVVMASLAAE
jgi:hypothetical protein